jgi:hypothetical protein
MTCKELSKLVDESALHNELARAAAERHAENCESCHQTLAVDRLAGLLIKNYYTPAAESLEPSPYWSTRLMARIHEMKEQSVSSWEAAIMGLKGWITALAAVAVVLIAAMLQGQFGAPDPLITGYNDFEEVAQPNSPEELITSAPDPGPRTGNLYE